MTIDRSGGETSAAANLRELWPFWIASAACWVGLTALWGRLRTDETRAVCADSSAPARGVFTREAAIVLMFAIAARGVVLLTHEPALSDDVYRYLFDGRNLAHGHNPYLTDPADRIAALHPGEPERWPGESRLLPLLAYPEITTPYLPLSHYVFAAIAAVDHSADPDSAALLFRCAFVIIELALMAGLLAALRLRGRSAWWLALYAWHPLAVSEFAGSGHQDVIGIALLVIALWTFERTSKRGGQAGARVWPGLLAASTVVKPVTALAGPMALRTHGPRYWLIAGVIGALVIVAMALPLRLVPGQPAFAAWQATADWMAEKAAHFGAVYEPVLLVVRHAMPDGPHRAPGFNLDQEWLARKICLGLFIVAMAAIWLRIARRDAWRATAAVLLALTLCSTTCHPWYLLWALALCPLAMSWTLWSYSLTIAWGYVVFAGGKGSALGVEWTVQPWIIAAAHLPVLAALIADVRSHLRHAQASPQPAES